jgi:hypothetical protein
VIEDGLFNLLSTSTQIAALCKTRIYPVLLPTAPTYPAVRYQIISATPRPTLDTSGFQRWRIQFDCFGANYSDAASLRGALMKLLNGYQGVLSDGTNLQNVEFIQLMETFADDARTYKCSVEFYLYFCFSS